jgi:hypothetical protein
LAPDQQLGSEIVRALQAADHTAVVTVAQRLVLDHPHTSHPDVHTNCSDGNSSSRASASRLPGLGAIHFLQKPFPRDDFVDLAQALLSPTSKAALLLTARDPQLYCPEAPITL